MKILITDYVWPNIDIEKKIIEDNGHELIVAPNSDQSTLINLIKDVDAILFCFADINEDVLEAAKKCKVACRYGIGVDNIDIQKATELGIIITNIPDYCLDEVSDHVLAMLLNLNRSIMPHDKKVKEGLWHEVNKVERIRRLNKSTLGIIGYGRIGKNVAKKANVFGIEVIAFDPLLKDDDQENNVKSVTLDYLFKNSDFITLHIPLIKETKHLISFDQIQIMKDDVIIINAARGGLIDEDALIKGLSSEKILGVGLDVMEDPNPKASNELFKFKNVIVTPHTAYFSQESNEELQERVVGEALTVLQGNFPENLINRDVIGKNRSNIN
ncbi:MAG: hydroxyacid dehydrogenase [Dehalococcoidia bacterium]|nr:hydroxyacid dehydrogenase [Dehalococcoidia bacterium]